jgi:hypothetical protein
MKTLGAAEINPADHNVLAGRRVLIDGRQAHANVSPPKFSAVLSGTDKHPNILCMPRMKAGMCVNRSSAAPNHGTFV